MTEIDIDRVDVQEDELPRDKREKCEQCGEVIVDQEIVIAQGKIWHKQHFRCSNDRCDVTLQEDYQARKGKIQSDSSRATPKTKGISS